MRYDVSVSYYTYNEIHIDNTSNIFDNIENGFF